MITHEIQFGDNMLIIWIKSLNTLQVIHELWHRENHDMKASTTVLIRHQVLKKIIKVRTWQKPKRKTIPGIGEYFQIGNGGVYRAEKNNFLFILNLIVPPLFWLGAWSFSLNLKITNQNSISCLSKPQNYLNTLSLQK